MTTTYTFEQLKEDVKKEAEALRVHATKEELGRLDIKYLDGNDIKLCIYGQMTGDCDSSRASYLIQKCAPCYFESESEELNIILNQNFAEFRWSPLEHYIRISKARNANLIAYLKGETDTLEL